MATTEAISLDPKGRFSAVARVITSGGTAIYALPVTTFPGHLNNIYFVDHPDCRLLFDVGTHFGQAELSSRLAELAPLFGRSVSLGDLDAAVISHAHIDHFGNAAALRAAGVPIWIHDLDFRVLANFQERLALVSRDFDLFLQRAGISDGAREQFMQLYRFEKRLFQGLTPDRRLQDGERIGPGWSVIHLPGHCPGLIALAVDDVVLTADHLLSRITPAQSPQSITPEVGLDRYLDSLDKLSLAGDFALALGGHDGPIEDIPGRIAAMRRHHRERLQKTHASCDSAKTIAEISRALFGKQKSYGILLALLEAAAHVEYLYEHGHLLVENYDQLVDSQGAAPRYRAQQPTLTLSDPRLR